MKHFFRTFFLRISTRLTMWFGLTLLVLLSLFALFSYLAFHSSLHRDFDRHLSHETRELVPYIRFIDNGSVAFAALDELRSVAYGTDGIYGTYVRLISPQGTILYSSPNFENHIPLAVRIPRTNSNHSISREWEGKPARSSYTPMTADSGDIRGWLEVSGFEWSLHQELYRLRVALLLGITLSMILAMGGGYWLARRALRPVAALTEAADEIRATKLTARLPTSFGVRDELTDLAESFNKMLSRIEASFDRERRFTDNAAHELLTPLTTMRNGIEVALRRERTREAYQQALESMMLDVEELTETVQGLLQLARVDRLKELPRRRVDLSRIVHQHTNRFQDRAVGKGIKLQQKILPHVHVLADEGRIGEVIDNLVDNAIKYSPDGATVTVEVSRQDDNGRLIVSDTGMGFDPEAKERLFDRFYRADAKEVQAQHGSGLGLAIVQAITFVYGGKISAESDGINCGSRFVVSLPTA